MEKILSDKEIEKLIEKENLTLEKFEGMKKDPVFGKRIVKSMLKENVRRIEKALREREKKVK